MGVSFLKTGAESLAMEKAYTVAQELAKESQGKMFRFFLGKKEDAKVTFIDGALNPEGFLVPMRYYEHMVIFNGQWTNFVCPEHTVPEQKFVCPICADGDKPSLVTLFTVIDHRTYQKDANSKVYKDTRKLFVAKPITFEILKKIATKRGGLAGITFDISRVGEKSPAVGDMFEFDKQGDIAELQKQYQETITDPKTNKSITQTYFVPADYEEEIVFRTPDELLKMGFGKGSGASAGVTSPAGSGGGAAAPEYAAVL